MKQSETRRTSMKKLALLAVLAALAGCNTIAGVGEDISGRRAHRAGHVLRRAAPYAGAAFPHVQGLSRSPPLGQPDHRHRTGRLGHHLGATPTPDSAASSEWPRAPIRMWSTWFAVGIVDDRLPGIGAFQDGEGQPVPRAARSRRPRPSAPPAAPHAGCSPCVVRALVDPDPRAS